MPIARIEGAELHYEETGTGFPLVLSHEFAGDCRSWEPQVRYFARRYRVITYNHRGYPPSSTPDDPAAYTQEHLVEDLHRLLLALGVEQAHVGGLSMGANVALNFGLRHPAMARSLIIAACGSGTSDRERFLQAQLDTAERLEREGIGALVAAMSAVPTRQAFRAKDPRGWAEFVGYLGEHPAGPAARLIRGVITRRRTIRELIPEMTRCPVPALIMVGDEDEPCIESSLLMQRHLTRAGLVVLPSSGHTINIEEPALFNLHVAEFLAAVEQGRWKARPAREAAEPTA